MSCRRHRDDRGRTAFAGCRPGADDAARLVVFMDCGLADRGADCDGGRLDHAHRCRLRLRCFNGLDQSGGGNGRHFGLRLRLRLDRDGRSRSLLRRCLFDGCRLFCGARVGTRFGRRSFGSCLLRRGLLDRLGLLRLLRTGQTITSRATFEPIGLCLDQRAGVSLHTDTHCVAQRHHFGVGHSELLGELVHSHVFRQNQFSLSLASARRSLFRRPISLSRW